MSESADRCGGCGFEYSRRVPARPPSTEWAHFTQRESERVGDVTHRGTSPPDDELDFDNIVYLEPDADYKYHAYFERLKAAEYRKVVRTEAPECIWYWGESGAGKSHRCFHNHGDFET